MPPAKPTPKSTASPTGLKPTRKRRNRKPATLSYLGPRLGHEISDLEVPRAFHGLRTDYKKLAAGIQERRDFMLWRGQGSENNDRRILERVCHGLLVGRVDAPGAEQE